VLATFTDHFACLVVCAENATLGAASHHERSIRVNVEALDLVLVVGYLGFAITDCVDALARHWFPSLYCSVRWNTDDLLSTVLFWELSANDITIVSHELLHDFSVGRLNKPHHEVLSTSEQNGRWAMPLHKEHVFDRNFINGFLKNEASRNIPNPQMIVHARSDEPLARSIKFSELDCLSVAFQLSNLLRNQLVLIDRLGCEFFNFSLNLVNFFLFLFFWLLGCHNLLNDRLWLLFFINTTFFWGWFFWFLLFSLFVCRSGRRFIFDDLLGILLNSGALCTSPHHGFITAVAGNE
jgi:hypothetical protein